MNVQSERTRMRAICMDVWVLSLVLLAAAAAPGRVRAEDSEIRRDEAAVHSAPGFKAPVVARPAVGTTVEIIERRKEWVRVRLREGLTGWVHEGFLAPSGWRPPAAAPARPVVPATGVDGVASFASQARPSGPLGSPPAPAGELERLRDENARVHAALDTAQVEVARLVEERDNAQQAARDEQEAANERFIKYVADKHDAALAEQRRGLDAECERRLIAERQHAEVERRKVAKESGWQADFDAAVREQVRGEVKVQVDELKARMQGAKAGAEFERERALREQAQRLGQECEQARIAAVADALARLRVELDDQRRKELEQEDMRCQLALELALEHIAEGGDVDSIRRAAEKARQPPEAPGMPAGEPASATAGQPAVPAKPPATQPVPATPRDDVGRPK